MNKMHMAALLAVPVFMLAGCNLEDKSDDPNDSTGNSTDDNDTGGSSDGTGTVRIDASAGWAYLSLAGGSAVTASDDWDLAFSRTSVRVNPDRATSALIVEQADFYDNNEDPIANVFTNATANSELEHLLANHDLEAFSYEAESRDAAIGRDGANFYDYDFATHVVSANDDAWWVLRSAEGDSFAKLNVTRVEYAAGSLELDADFFVQGSTDSTYAGTAVEWSATVADGEQSCYDFDNDATVDCATSSDWDIKLVVDGHSFLLLTNGGVSGGGDAGVYGALTSTEATAETDGSALSSYAFAEDKGANALTEHSWYAYNLTGQHGIWPNFRVYGIRNTDSEAVTLVQLINYYDDADNSGHITVRYKAEE